MKSSIFGGLALLVATAFLVGSPAQDKDKGAKGGGNGHAEFGPHHGALAEWGEEEYHVEVTFDHKAKQATAYVLDGSAKKAKPIDAKELILTLKQKPAVTVKLLASPQDGDPQGATSRFVAKHDAFGKHQDCEGTVSGKVGTKPYAGDFEHKHTHDQEKK
jgi:hypothetical protein